MYEAVKLQHAPSPEYFGSSGKPFASAFTARKAWTLKHGVPYFKLKKIVNDKHFCSFFENTLQRAIICSSMIQLLTPFSHFLLVISWQLFLLQEVFFPPPPTLSEVSTRARKKAGTASPHVLPLWVRHPGPRVRNECQEISS